MLEVGSLKNDPSAKAKWLSVLTMDFMSSDESANEDGNDVLVSRPLKWESASVTQFKCSIDDIALKQKSPLARRHMKTRKRGLPSDRSNPCGDYPIWAFN